jgi:hypothetical protein
MLGFFLRSMVTSKLQAHSIIPSLPNIDPPPPASAPLSSSSSAAAVAPAPNPSLQPFSSSSQPIPAKRAQQTQNAEARRSNADAAAAAQPSSSSHSGPRTETQKKMSKKISDLNFLSSLFNKALSAASSHPAYAAASSSSSSASASSSSSFSMSLADAAACHCLVVDDLPAAGRLLEGSDNWKQYKEALALEGDRDALLQHVAKWFQLPPADISIAYVAKQNPPRLHINFRLLPVLGQALLAHPFLVRCGSVGAWSKPCGVNKREQPELLHLSCVPSHPREKAKLTEDVTQLLTDMGLLYTSFWFPRDLPENRVVVYVLPRNLAALEAEINRLHLKYELRGSKVRVQGVNTLALKRCHQCERLGHNPDACSMYSGMALRLIGKKPLSYLLLQELQKRTGARKAFLGSSFDEMQPSRRLTLLFDMTPGQEEERMAELASRLFPIFAELHSLLHGSPYCVDISDRQRECRECGSMARPHECPFMDPTRAARPQALAGAAVSASSSASSAADKMCGSWSRTRTCAKKGLGCSFSHPEGHIVAQKSKECFAFQRNGHCHVGSTCPYKHTEGLARPANASAASDAAARPATSKTSDKPSGQVSYGSAPLVAAATSAAAAPASSPVASTPTASPTKKKRQRAPAAEAEAQPEEEEEVKQQSNAAKKQKPVQGIPTHPTQWSEMLDAAEEEDEGERPASPPPRSSSLASISSPSSSIDWGGGAAAAAASARGRGRPPTKPGAASASAKAPSRSSSSSRKGQQ